MQVENFLIAKQKAEEAKEIERERERAESKSLEALPLLPQDAS